MATSSITPIFVSPQLSTWIRQHKAEIASRVPALQQIQGGSKRQEVLKHIIKSSTFILDVWSSVLKSLKESNGPEELKAEANRIESLLTGKHNHLSHHDQAGLLELADVTPKPASAHEARLLVEQFVESKKLSKDVGDKVIEAIEASRAKMAQGPLAAIDQFNWGACAFIGALGLVAGGPAGGALGCLIGGLFVD
ncbi:MAG TPA: hypothetical protein VG649_07420 [Candidatus Angelobacter sp.]|nr:hypothetical protein [Candidatus Angelobacter sp.]